MPTPKTARGRPKGTGRDDRAILMSVIKMVETNPHLKPTTAIKSIGVTDPSAIRRLRDKFHVAQGQTHAKVSPKRVAAAPPAAAPSRAVALKSVKEPVRSAVIPAKQAPRSRATLHSAAKSKSEAAASLFRTDPTAKLLAASSAPDTTNWLSLWAELSLQTMAASLNAQWILYDHVLRSSPVTAAFGGHAVLTGFAAAWCATSPDPGKTVH